jgi:transcriptional regulator GlxA family with amidase domain
VAPLAVFETANMVAGKPLYELSVLSEYGGPLPNSLGMSLETDALSDRSFDTLLIGAGPTVTPVSPKALTILQDYATRTRRIVAISIGAFILAEAGLLDGRRATTHWAYARELQQQYPKIAVEMDRIFIADGPIWTSAGMTSGIDLALSLIERDVGPALAKATARALVVHHRRAGGQSQHSEMLELDAKSDRVQDALAFARKNLREPLTIEQLAEAARLSPRQFTRVFRIETGQTPARAVENLRLEVARYMLEQGRLPIETIAQETGFGDRERMRRSFLRTYGRTPQAIRNASHPLATL